MLLEKQIPLRYIFENLWFDIGIVVIFAVSSHVITLVYKEYVPLMPLNIPVFLGTAISIVLSFKINQSYERWWEARKVWGEIVNDSRTLVIQLQSFVADQSNPIITRIAHRQIAFNYCFGQELRNGGGTKDIDKLVSSHELNEVSNHANNSLALLKFQALDLRQLHDNNQLDIFSHIQLNSTVARLVDATGKAERIKTTIFPTTYRLFLHLTIYVFVVTLSISLRDVNLVFELPLTIILSLIFLLLEKAAFYLQDPFANRESDIPVTAIARKIEINIRQLLKEKEIPPPLETDKYYIM